MQEELKKAVIEPKEQFFKKKNLTVRQVEHIDIKPKNKQQITYLNF